MADTEGRWSINESLLQSYRSIFISSQSFLLAVGAIVSGKNEAVLFVTAAASLVMIWLIWFPVVRARHKIVDYYKYSVTLSEPDRSQLCTEHQYVHNRELRKRANALFQIDTNWRPTRVKIDLMIPVAFSLIWIVLVAYEMCAA